MNRVTEINKNLEKLNKDKSRLLQTLTEKDAFRKYKYYQNELLKVEAELQKNRDKLEELTVIERETKKLDNIASDIKSAIELIGQEIKSENQLYNAIRTSFSEYVKEILNQPGLLSISQNGAGNIEFYSEICNEDTITSQGRGHSYKKILCACFDLALATNYADKSFFKFVFHDGCLETLDPRKQKKYLDLISRLTKEYNIQYILALIESDLPTISGKAYSIPENGKIAVELSDINDTTNLFGFTF